MTLVRKKKDIIIGTWTMVVWEENWDLSTIPETISQQARTLRQQLNGSGSPALLDFHEAVYPWLAAYSVGVVPTVEQAFGLPSEDLDVWYWAVRETNPDLFEEPIPEPVTVTFRDNSQVTVRSSRLPSVLRNVFIQDEAADRWLEEHPTELGVYGRRKIYAKIAGCSEGDVPSFEEAQDWPASELNRWYAAVMTMNPQFFLSKEEVLARLQAKQGDEDSKKNIAPDRSLSS